MNPYLMGAVICTVICIISGLTFFRLLNAKKVFMLTPEQAGNLQPAGRIYRTTHDTFCCAIEGGDADVRTKDVFPSSLKSYMVGQYNGRYVLFAPTPKIVDKRDG